MGEEQFPSPNAAELEDRSGLTALDQLAANAVVDSKREVVGALPDQALIRAVEEFVNLNARRPQSQFTLGFRDALFSLPFAEALRTQEREGVRWYWAGVVEGLARRNAWNRIVDVHDDRSVVRELGNGVDAVSIRAGPHIARSLWETGRSAELPRFVGLDLVHLPEVNDLLLKAGTEALRRWNPGEARGMLELLMRCAETLRPSDPLLKSLPTVHRRMAHCLRLLGEHERARSLLEALLEGAEDTGVRAMVQTDLGLMAGRFNLLDDVRIHGDAEACQEVVDRLKAGEDRFHAAVADADVAYASHGYYCLGVLALAEACQNDVASDGLFERADHCLERARANFFGNSNYPRSLVSRTDLYLGIAKSQRLKAEEIRHAADLIAAGLDESDFPAHFLTPVLDALDLDKTGESVAAVVEPLMALDDDGILDALSDRGISQSHPPLRDKLLQRARRGDRPLSLAAVDLRRVLPGYLKTKDHETALGVLDQLESLALEQHSGLTEFGALLESPDNYDPAWEWEDATIARARSLTLEGRGADAFEALSAVFRVLMDRGDTNDARDVLERMRKCEVNLSEAGYEGLKNWYERQANEAQPLVSNEDGREPVNVLVVGGNELQDRFNKRVADRVARIDRQVSVEFLRTGWSGNWNGYVEDVRRRLPNLDAVVMLRYIRTGLGRHVRAMCGEHGVPWRFCYAGGQDAQARAVLEVSGAARAQR